MNGTSSWTIYNPPGQTAIQYRVGDFASVRTALLTPLRGETELVDWRPAAEGDLAVQLLEWWAYLADILTFYNERIANESYVETATQLPTAMQLTGLVGYTPPPATAATGTLAAIVTGNNTVTLPQGFQLQSSPGPGKTPQVFETSDDAQCLPSAGGGVVPLDTTQATTIASRTDGTQSTLLFDAPATGVAVGDVVVVAPTASISDPSAHAATVHTFRARESGATLPTPVGQPLRVTAMGTVTDPLGRTRYSVTFSGAPGPSTDDVAGYSLLRSPQSQVLSPYIPRPRLVERGDEDTILVLSLAAPARTMTVGDLIVLEGTDQTLTAVTLVEYAERWYPPLPPTPKPEELALMREPSPPPSSPQPSILHAVIRVTTGAGAAKGDGDPQRPASPPPLPDIAKVRYGFAPIKTRSVGDSLASISMANGPLKLVALATPTPSTVTNVLIEDGNQQGSPATSQGADPNGNMTLTVTGPNTLVAPVRVLANTFQVSEGKTVKLEVLGSGDASAASQTFSLQHAPLTYVPDPAGGTPKTTLQVSVDGAPWTPADNFFGAGPNDRIYVVQHDAAQGTTIRFGNGKRGARLPTGRGNVTASYRYGAGTDVPPPMTLATMVTAQPGIGSVRNPAPLTPGAPAPDVETVRDGGPKSVQHIDRAVTAGDFEAIAMHNGATWSRATIVWDARKRRTAIVVYAYAADASTFASVKTAVNNASPHAGVTVRQGRPVKVSVHVTVFVLPRTDRKAVKDGVTTALLQGPLASSQLNLNRPPDRGRIRAACHDVEGVLAASVEIRGEPDTIAPDAFFPVAPDQLHVHTEVERHG